MQHQLITRNKASNLTNTSQASRIPHLCIASLPFFYLTNDIIQNLRLYLAAGSKIEAGYSDDGGKGSVQYSGQWKFKQFM